MKKATLFAVCLSVLVSLLLLSGCSGKPDEVQEGTMLFDYYEKTEGLPNGSGDYEIVLTALADSDKVCLDVYVKASETAQEEKTSYHVPAGVVQEVMAAVEEHGMQNWNSRDSMGMTGLLIVCKFPQNEETVRVSSDNMPADGRIAFNAVKSVLQSYISDGYLAE